MYVDDGRRDSVANAQSLARQANYAWYFDTGGRWNTAVGVRAYPTAYLVSQADGYRVVWQGIPVFDPRATEQAIRASLSR